MKCPNCGTENDNSETTCKICGNLLENTLKNDDAEVKDVEIITISESNAEDANQQNREDNDTKTQHTQQNANNQDYITSYENPEYNNQNQRNYNSNQEYNQQFQNQGYNQQDNQNYNQQYPNNQNYNQQYQNQNFNQQYSNQGYSQPRPPVAQKSKAIAIVLGLIIWGGGMCYANRWGEGIAYFIILWLMFLLSPLIIPFFIWVILGIYSLVKTSQYIDDYNRGIIN